MENTKMVFGRRIYVVINWIIFFVFATVVFIVFTNKSYVSFLSNYVSGNYCVLPITYQVVSVDKRFGLDFDKFSAAVDEAVKQWNSTLNTTAFVKASGAALKVSLVYDERQADTQLLKNINSQISSGKSNIEDLRLSYDQAKSSYNSLVADYDKTLSTIQTKSDDYAKQVSFWNSKGGAPKETYNQLNSLRNDIQTLQNILEQKRSLINQTVAVLNQLASQLNALAGDVNSSIKKYNSVGIVGQEFEQGIYSAKAGNKNINVYQYNNMDKLSKVLLHEFGHSLGLGHVSSSASIMYYMNQDGKQNILPSDERAVMKNCRQANWFDNLRAKIRL
ncbi:MAG: matrixin family metalloprotease [bacterium]